MTVAMHLTQSTQKLIYKGKIHFETQRSQKESETKRKTGWVGQCQTHNPSYLHEYSLVGMAHEAHHLPGA